MQKEYINKLLKLKKKLDAINSIIYYGFNEYYSWNFEMINKTIREWTWKKKLQIRMDEVEYVCFWNSCFTFDWESRFNLELKEEDNRNLNLYLNNL